MALVAGADGCPLAGWVRVVHDTARRAVHADVAADAATLFAREPRPDVLVVDIPIGLPDAGPRECDHLARRLLGARGSSVFPAPLRTALDAVSWQEAHARTQAANAAAGLAATGLSVQAWNLVAKVRDVDAALSVDDESWVHEGHPELAFRLWSGETLAGKKTADGRRQRAGLVDRDFGRVARERVRSAFALRDVRHDDLLDAFACAWIAERVARGDARCLPPDPPRDARGLRMAIFA